jgi:hypothetical protein
MQILSTFKSVAEAAAGVISWFVSTISIVMLLRHGFSIDLSAFAQSMLDQYEVISKVAFGWAEPFIEAMLDTIRRSLYWDLHLYPHWKHVFVLLMVYFGVDTRTLMGIRDKGWPILQAIVGVLIAIVASIVAGCIPVSFNQSTVSDNLLLASAPLLGMSAFLFTSCVVLASSSRKHWLSFWTRLAENGTRLMQATVALLLGGGLLWYSQAVPVDSTASPWLGLALVAGAIFALGISFFVSAQFASPNEPLRVRHGRIGVYVLAVFAGVLFFLFMDAAAKLAGF